MLSAGWQRDPAPLWKPTMIFITNSDSDEPHVVSTSYLPTPPVRKGEPLRLFPLL